ncbi:Isocitrate lyase [Enterobacter cancerogenus]|uniref:Isocitrate lyase n=1 Tax=Enterobacter cancerogenus TaxID=69218 RepID=A0A484XS63_9ENTR|nr:Isocitrate lyase [Enterobacter cancerogenus]
MKTRTQQIEELQKEWTQPRWEGIRRPYSAEEVVKLRGSVNPECTLAQHGAAKIVGTAARRCQKRLHQQPGRADRGAGAAAGRSRD